MTTYIDSGWRYYIPDDGGTPDNADPVMVYSWRNYGYWDAEDAAAVAWEMVWDNAHGDYGVGEGPEIVVISPKGEETKFKTEAEASVNYLVQEIEG